MQLVTLPDATYSQTLISKYSIISKHIHSLPISDECWNSKSNNTSISNSFVYLGQSKIFREKTFLIHFNFYINETRMLYCVTPKSSCVPLWIVWELNRKWYSKELGKQYANGVCEKFIKEHVDSNMQLLTSQTILKLPIIKEHKSNNHRLLTAIMGW